MYFEDLFIGLHRPPQPMKSFIFLKAYIFEELSIWSALCQKYVVNIIFKQFTKCCFRLQFYNLINKIGKRKEEGDNFLWKNRRKTKQRYHNDICRWKRDISIDVDVFPQKLKIKGESFV